MDWTIFLVIYLWILGGFMHGCVMIAIRTADKKEIGLWHVLMTLIWPIAMPLGMLKNFLGGRDN